jgi:PAS domain S-box-containing protein
MHKPESTIQRGAGSAAPLQVPSRASALPPLSPALPDLTRVLLDSMTEGVSLASEDGTIVYTNSAEDRMFGYDPGELVGRNVSVQNAYPPEENARAVESVIAELKRTGAWRGEWLNRRKDGTTFVTTSRISAVELDGARHWLCVQEDVTDAKAAASALEESQARLELATDAAELGIWDWDVASGRMTYSARAKQICGFAPDQEVTYEDARRVTHRHDYPRTSEMARRALDPALRETVPYKYRIVRSDGTIRWVLAHGEAVFAERDGETRAIRYVGTLQDITDRVRLEEADERSKARLALAIDAGRMAVWEVDLVTDEITGSPELNRLLGFAEDAEPSLDDIRARYCVGEHERLRTLAKAAFEGPGVFDAEFCYLWPDESIRWLWLRAEQISDAEGKPSRAVGVVMDVTERKRAEAAIRDNEERLRLVQAAGGIGSFDYDLQKDDAICSPEYYALFGLPDGYRINRQTWPAAIHPDDREQAMQALDRAIAERKPFDYEYRIIRADTGEVRWLAGRAAILFDADDKPWRYVGGNIDITARKQSELRHRTLMELADRFRDLDAPADLAFAAAESLGHALGVSRVGYGTVDPLTETITIERDWNAPGIRTLAGVLHFRDYGSYIEDLKRGDTVVFDDAEKDPRTAATADALEAISAQAVVNMPVSERGGLVALLYLNNATARKWTAEELALVREVAERTRAAIARHEAEGELRELNRTLERRVDEALAERKLWVDVFESSDALIGALSPDRCFVALNTAYADEFERLFGVRPGVGDCLPDLLAHMPDHQAATVAMWDRALAGEEFTTAEEFGDPSGARPCYELRFNTLRSRDGEVIGAFQYAVDITERMRTQAKLAEAEEALRQSQKMEAMGQLTGGVAHDFNNLLTPIVGTLDLLQHRGLGGEREQRLVDGALQSAERAKTLVQRLLAFARRQPLQPTAVDLPRLIEGMADLVASTSGPRVKLTVDVAPDLPPVHADANQLEMAILNLAVNARDAMPDGGALTIAAAGETLATDNSATLEAGRYVRLSIADTGKGMDEATLTRAIEPFFSTKGLGRGTGLGLSMVHGLAAQLGGALKIQSKPGIGTKVELWLPISPDATASPERGADKKASPAAGTVLLVDDEELIRISTADMLSELGYDVVEAASAEQAINLVDEGLHVDLLVTDHLMPGMTGTELARALRERRPAMQVLVVSGYAEVDDVAPDLPRLAKPFRRTDLAASVANLATATGSRQPVSN